MADLNYITITYGGISHQITRPPDFKLQREDILASEYVTCTGLRCGDIVGWRYSDMTLEWGALPQSMVEILINMTGQCSMTFDDPSGDTITEGIVRTSAVALRNRNQIDGVTWWKNVSVGVKFVGSH